MSIPSNILERVKNNNLNEPEFVQAVEEVFNSIMDLKEVNGIYAQEKILERIVEPERVILFRVVWQDDNGKINVNRGYRVQFNSALGPYKGGLRFHPSVNLSILKFLGFEQTFKNSLTGIPMGGAKGGSDFNPAGKSDSEIMRFCQAFMAELYKYIGDDVDIPAGDIGVGAKEIGYMFGTYKKLTNKFNGTFTGKGIDWGGSNIRTEATGYGLLYFVQEILIHRKDNLEGKAVLISGSGNVAQYAAEKAIQLGAKVITMSDSSGFIYDKDGITLDKLEWIKELKEVRNGRIKEYAENFGVEYFEGKKPWSIKADIALPCATQNEVTIEDAKSLVENGVKLVAEGANMPLSNEAINYLHKNKVLHSPGKASNAGGVATSGLEMSQNSAHLQWTRSEVDSKLKTIMQNIHKQCLKYGTETNYINYVKGANIAGFKKVADAMIAQGLV